MTQSLTLLKWLIPGLLAVLVLVVASLKGKWLSPTEIDTIAKAVSGFGLVAAGVWAIITYYHNKRQEFQKNFNDRQVEVVLLTANAVGDLAGSQCSKDWDNAKARFWEMYWGRLVLFEDDAVIKAMVDLGEKLLITQYEQRGQLAGPVYQVSLKLRDFLKKKNDNEWRISFADRQEETKKTAAAAEANKRAMAEGAKKSKEM
jgi:hypothetical protein